MVNKPFGDIITFTRTSGGGRFNSSGVYEWLGNNVPRFDYDPVTLQPLGILIEEERTNRLLNSATVVTQNVSTTATANTLSFYGTGTITLSGTATGLLVGTGVANRVSLTFTPTAGTLTLTVTGNCTSGQLEEGAFPTSYIPTEANQVTRAADIASVNTLSPWYNASEGTLYFEGSVPVILPTGRPGVTLGNAAADNRFTLRQTLVNGISAVAALPIVTVFTPPAVNPIAGVPWRQALSFNASNIYHSVNGGPVAAAAHSVNLANISTLYIGSTNNLVGQQHSGHIRSLRYWPRLLSNAELQQVTA